MNGDTLVNLAGLVIALATFGFGLWKAVITTIEKHNDALNKRIDDLHSRINDVKDNYVRREDFDKLERQVERIGDDVKQAARDTNSRLDTILSMLAKGKETA